jgi:hypothetical protein
MGDLQPAHLDVGSLPAEDVCGREDGMPDVCAPSLDDVARGQCTADGPHKRGLARPGWQISPPTRLTTGALLET